MQFHYTPITGSFFSLSLLSRGTPYTSAICFVLGHINIVTAKHSKNRYCAKKKTNNNKGTEEGRNQCWAGAATTWGRQSLSEERPRRRPKSLTYAHALHTSTRLSRPGVEKTGCSQKLTKNTLI